MAKLDVNPAGGLAFDPRFFVEFERRDAAAPGAAAGRRRVVRLVLLRVMTGLGHGVASRRCSARALHGINPGMGWLFAVALGLQEQQRRGGVARPCSRSPSGTRRRSRSRRVLAAVGGVVPAEAAALAGRGRSGRAGRLPARPAHASARRDAGRTAGARAWSLLMASAHGAGLMVLPLVLQAT